MTASDGNQVLFEAGTSVHRVGGVTVEIVAERPVLLRQLRCERVLLEAREAGRLREGSEAAACRGEATFAR